MSETILDMLIDKKYETIVDQLFDKKGNRKMPIKNELVDVLEKRGDEIVDMYEDFNNRQSNESLHEMKKHFPELSDYREKPLEIKEFEPEVTKIVCTSMYMEEKMPEYYEQLERKISELRDYLETGNSEAGRQIYMNLIRGRRMSDKKSREWLLEATEHMDQELTDYEEEAEAYEGRDVGRFGLITNDAVKCLNDYEGRTFPFVRSIIKNVNEGDKVLEVGAGTGVLSISSAIAGAESVIGIELNPITVVLTDIITEDLYVKGLLARRESVNIVWSDALKFGVVEYDQYADHTFDTLISENIYTGMFYELQMQMIARVMENGLVESGREIINGFTHRTTSANVIPEAMASAAELVDLGDYESDLASEVLIDIEANGHGVKKQLCDPQPYDILEYSVEEPSNIMAKMRCKMKSSGSVDAINIYSIVRLSEGDYIMRNENEFLNNDHIVHLNNSIDVEEGDEVLMTIAYNEADSIKDGIFEVRKIDPNGHIAKEPDARLNIDQRQHEVNKLRYKDRNSIKQELELSKIGDMEKLRCSSYYHDYEHTWRTNLRF